MPVSSFEIATTGHVVFLHQRQHHLQALFLARDRVEQRAAFGGFKTGLKRAGHGAVDA